MPDNTSYMAIESSNTEWAYIGCFCCGKPVRVHMPFIGCVYCEECSKAGNYESIGTEDFTPSFKVG